MSRIANSLMMYMILQDNSPKPISINYLANKLEVSDKTVRILRDELEEAGFQVDSIRGRYGGYFVPQGSKRLRWERTQ